MEYPRVMAQAVDPAPRMEMSGIELPKLSGTQRVPLAGQMPQKQTVFDMGAQKAKAPWGARPVTLLGTSAPALEGSQEAPAGTMTMSRSLSQSASVIYPEIDKILERQAASKPLTQGEAQALYQALDEALAYVTAPEHANESCVKSLSTDIVSRVSAFKGRMATLVPAMKATDLFQATDQELQAAERVLECSGSIAPKAGMPVWPWLVGGGLVLAAIYFVATKKKK